MRCPCMDEPMYVNIGDPNHDGSPVYCERCDETGEIPDLDKEQPTMRADTNMLRSIAESIRDATDATGMPGDYAAGYVDEAADEIDRLEEALEEYARWSLGED